MTNAPTISDDDADILAPAAKTEEEIEALKNNNNGDFFTVTADFPAISLGQQWATLTIESIGLIDAPVYHGDSSDILWQGVGHYSNSRFPGQNGKVVLASHVAIADFGFTKLEQMVEGETVVLDTIYGEYVYQVRETVIFDENDSSLLQPGATDDGDVLICYTCYPYVTTSIRTQRFAIVCDKISGKDWTKGAAEE
jgi:sortase A